MYFCTTGTLLVPSERCVGPECRGGPKTGAPLLGFQGDLDAGSTGSFMSAGRLIGTRAYDGIEIGKGLQQIEQLRQEGAIDNYYAGAAKRAYAERFKDDPERAAPFETPSPFDGPLAPGALGRLHRGQVGTAVGGTASESCGCTPREFDAVDPISGWGMYFIGDGVLLTPSQKCIAGTGRGPRWWQQTWKNVLSLWETPAPVPGRVSPPAPTAPRILPGTPPPEAPPPPPKTYLCMDPRIWPLYYRPQQGPCVAPQIEYTGT
jgi:hypothetical protein